MANIIFVAGIGFGDEGKGSVVDYLAFASKRPPLVVRYNGGAQTAHNVVTPDGKHHTFAQFGSGMLAGADTHLSRYVLINPVALETEAQALKALGFKEPFSYLTVEREALVTNIYQVAANRLRETLRNKNRHGSCGMGIGETVQDSLDHPDMTIRVDDLLNKGTLARKLRFSREKKLAEFAACDGIANDKNLLIIKETNPNRCAETYRDIGRRIQIVDHDFLLSYLQNNPKANIIFEGAQGVLLDLDYGFFPYVTRTDITFNNAYALLDGYSGPVRKIGVLRGYTTRHGAGPFPTEIRDADTEIAPDVHNTRGEWQEGFRLGHFDAVLARYALKVLGGVDELMITNLDKLGDNPKICLGYTIAPENAERLSGNHVDGKILVTDLPVQQPLNYYECVQEQPATLQEKLTEDLMKVVPILEDKPKSNRFYPDLIVSIIEELDTPVSLWSQGPTRQDKAAGNMDTETRSLELLAPEDMQW
jgi:adenylosuccinate synthase